jgi:hypothetical protein
MTMAGFEPVRATVATPINDPGGDSRSRRSKTTKRSHDYVEIAGTDDEMGLCSQTEGDDAENQAGEDRRSRRSKNCKTKPIYGRKRNEFRSTCRDRKPFSRKRSQLTVTHVHSAPSTTLEGTVARVGRKLPNEATIISRLLELTMRWVRAVRLRVTTPRLNREGIRRWLRSKSAKTKPICCWKRKAFFSTRGDRKTVFAKTKPICCWKRNEFRSTCGGRNPISRKRSQLTFTHAHSARLSGLPFVSFVPFCKWSALIPRTWRSAGDGSRLLSEC